MAAEEHTKRFQSERESTDIEVLALRALGPCLNSIISEPRVTPEHCQVWKNKQNKKLAFSNTRWIHFGIREEIKQNRCWVGGSGTTEVLRAYFQFLYSRSLFWWCLVDYMEYWGSNLWQYARQHPSGCAIALALPTLISKTNLQGPCQLLSLVIHVFLMGA